MNIFNPYTGWPVDSFQSYGKNISELLKQYPITNMVWHVYGEEFITSKFEILGMDSQLLDAWCRPFPKYAQDTIMTYDKPSKHICIKTTIQSSEYVFRIFYSKLNMEQIICSICGIDQNCVECKGTKKKLVYYPPSL